LLKPLPLLASLIALVIALLLALPDARAQGAGADYPLPNGHFFTQAGGDSPEPDDGFPIVNHVSFGGQEVRFWDEFRRYGGVAVVGYPASRPFTWDGFHVQVMQKGVFQWRPDAGAGGQAWFMNVFDEFTRHGLDQRLHAEKQVPLPANFDDAGKSFEQITAERIAILDARPAFAAQYRSVPDPLALYGLPTSHIEDFGPFYVVRLQRAAFQEWKIDAPGIARVGEVTVVNGGDVAKEMGLIPRWAAAPLPPPAASNQVIVYTPGRGQEVRSPVTVVGDARAFEATVQWELTQDGTGDVLGRGFTTAQTAGEWARFQFDLPFAVDRPRQATLAVWGASGRDAAERPGEVRIPLGLRPGGPVAAENLGLLIQPLRVEVSGQEWRVRIRLENRGVMEVNPGPMSFGLRDDATGTMDETAQIALAWVINPGDVREEVVGFHFPRPVSAADVRLLYRGQGQAGAPDAQPLVLDLPTPGG
jgi:hypothetical protein